jgi:hypothetical protein
VAAHGAERTWAWRLLNGWGQVVGSAAPKRVAQTTSAQPVQEPYTNTKLAEGKTKKEGLRALKRRDLASTPRGLAAR